MSCGRMTPIRGRRRRGAGRSGSGPVCISSIASRTGSSRWRWCGSSSSASRPAGREIATSPPTRRPKMSRSVRTPGEAAVVVHDEHRIAGPGPLDRGDAVGEARARRTVSGSRRPRTLSFSSMRDGTRATTARSVSSVTPPSVAGLAVRPVVPGNRRHGLRRLLASGDGSPSRSSESPSSSSRRAASGPAGCLANPVYAAGIGWLQLLRPGGSRSAQALAWAWLLISAERRRGAPPPQPAAALWPRSGSASGTQATREPTTPGLETVPAWLAGVLVYIYPAIVAVLYAPIRDADSRAPAVDRPGDRTRRRRARPRRHRPGGAAARCGRDPRPRLAADHAGWIILSARLAGERSEQPGPGTEPAVAPTPLPRPS